MNFKHFLQIIPLIFFSAAIFWFSHQSQPPIPDIGFQWQDKLYHFLAYFIYGLSASLAARAIFPNASRNFVFIFLILTVIIYGASDEFHQSFIPGRSSEFADWIADSLGGIAAALVIIFLSKKREIPKQE